MMPVIHALFIISVVGRIRADSNNLDASEIRTAPGFRRLAVMAFVVFVLGGQKGSAVFNLHSLPPAIIEAKRFSLSTIRRKRSRIGSMRRSEILQARTERPAWSIIPDVSPGTS